MNKKLIYYFSVAGVFISLIYLIIGHAPVANKARIVSNVNNAVSAPITGWQFNLLDANMHHPLSILLLQIIVILFVSKLFGIVFTRIGQSAVIGEIIAGIFLGPSLLGYFFPDITAFLFSPESVKNLQFLSQIGLMFFMFVVGMEVDMDMLRNKVKGAVVISHTSIVFSFFIGVLVAVYVYEDYAPANISFTAFALFMGIAMSITAFPVLARILKDRNLTNTPLGVLAITTAAIDDVTAWCLLALVIAIAKAGNLTGAAFEIILALTFVATMYFVVKPLLKKIADRFTIDQKISKTLIAISFFLLLVSSYTTEVIGIHALFGAFMAGLVMPHNAQLKQIITDKIEDVSIVLLLPVFFAYTGLRTHINLLADPSLIFICVLIIFAAITGKLAGVTIAARVTGHSKADSMAMGILMNTRGLMELVVLNIGFDLGILSPQIFAVMVVMAIVTTMMTNPMLNIAGVTSLHKN